MITKTCYCGKEFKTYPSKIKIGKGKYCSKECCLVITNKILEKNGAGTRWQKGQKPWSYKGFSYTCARPNGKEYRLIFMPEHPDASTRGCVREHRLVMEKHLCRRLLSSEIVHHKDGNTLNNDVSNLEVMDKKEHDRMNVRLNVHKRWFTRKNPVGSFVNQ